MADIDEKRKTLRQKMGVNPIDTLRAKMGSIDPPRGMEDAANVGFNEAVRRTKVPRGMEDVGTGLHEAAKQVKVPNLLKDVATKGIFKAAKEAVRPKWPTTTQSKTNYLADRPASETRGARRGANPHVSTRGEWREGLKTYGGNVAGLVKKFFSNLEPEAVGIDPKGVVGGVKDMDKYPPPNLIMRPSEEINYWKNLAGIESKAHKFGEDPNAPEVAAEGKPPGGAVKDKGSVISQLLGPSEAQAAEVSPSRKRAFDMAGMAFPETDRGAAVEAERFRREDAIDALEEEAAAWKLEHRMDVMMEEGLNTGVESDYMLPEGLKRKLHIARNAVPIQNMTVYSGASKVSGGGYFDPRTNETYGTMAEALMGQHNVTSEREVIAMDLLKSLLAKKMDKRFAVIKAGELGPDGKYLPGQEGGILDQVSGHVTKYSDLHKAEVELKFDSALSDAVSGDYDRLAEIFMEMDDEEDILAAKIAMKRAGVLKATKARLDEMSKARIHQYDDTMPY